MLQSLGFVKSIIDSYEILSQMIAPDPTRLARRPTKKTSKTQKVSNEENCNIPIYNPAEMRVPNTNKYSNGEYQSTNFCNSLWKQQQNRKRIYIIEGVGNDANGNGVGGLRMKTRAGKKVMFVRMQLFG